MDLQQWTQAEMPPNGVRVLPEKRAIIYCRVSSPGQKDNGSLEEQEARCRIWCEEHGYQVILRRLGQLENAAVAEHVLAWLPLSSM